MKSLILGISGASGAHLGLKFLQHLPREIECYCVVSAGAQKVYEQESRLDSEISESGASESKESKISESCAAPTLDSEILKLNCPNIQILKNNDLGAKIASGSALIESMAIVPCSCDMLAKIAHGFADDLISRAANVMIKENRQLLLAVREMPLSAIMLENMLKLSNLGVQIAPPIAGFYAAQNLDQMENFFIGKWFDLLGIKHNLYRRWGAK